MDAPAELTSTQLLMSLAVGLAMGACASVVSSIGGEALRGHAVLVAAISTPYLAFAAIDGRTRSRLVELVAAAAFLFVAMPFAGDRAWILAVALVAHAVWDAVHVCCDVTRTVAWWPPWCAAFDLAAAAGLLIATSL